MPENIKHDLGHIKPKTKPVDETPSSTKCGVNAGGAGGILSAEV